MTYNETLSDRRKKAPADASEPFSAAWWERRTAEELRDIIKRGFSGGEAFQGAVTETERRARKETSRLRHIAAIEAEQRQKRKRVFIIGSIAAFSVAAGVYAIAG
jgi:hypothetical protein